MGGNAFLKGEWRGLDYTMNRECMHGIKEMFKNAASLELLFSYFLVLYHETKPCFGHLCSPCPCWSGCFLV